MVRPKPKREEKHEHDDEEAGKCTCPYCNKEVTEEDLFCVGCGKMLKKL